MFSLKLKGVSKIGLGALGGVISGGFSIAYNQLIDGIIPVYTCDIIILAILGIFFGWILFPALVAINIDKVYINFEFSIFFFLITIENVSISHLGVFSTANYVRRRN